MCAAYKIAYKSDISGSLGMTGENDLQTQDEVSERNLVPFGSKIGRVKVWFSHRSTCEQLSNLETNVCRAGE